MDIIKNASEGGLFHRDLIQRMFALANAKDLRAGEEVREFTLLVALVRASPFAPVAGSKRRFLVITSF